MHSWVIRNFLWLLGHDEFWEFWVSRNHGNVTVCLLNLSFNYLVLKIEIINNLTHCGTSPSWLWWHASFILVVFQILLGWSWCFERIFIIDLVSLYLHHVHINLLWLRSRSHCLMLFYVLFITDKLVFDWPPYFELWWYVYCTLFPWCNLISLPIIFLKQKLIKVETCVLTNLKTDLVHGLA